MTLSSEQSTVSGQQSVQSPETHNASQTTWNGRTWVTHDHAGDALIWDGAAWVRTGVSETNGVRPNFAVGLAGAALCVLGGFVPFVNQYADGIPYEYFKSAIRVLPVLLGIGSGTAVVVAHVRRSRAAAITATVLGAIGLIGYVLFLIGGANGADVTQGFITAHLTWTPNIGLIMCLIGFAAIIVGSRLAIRACRRADR